MSEEQENNQLESGAYEVIRARMAKHGTELQQRLNQLNDERRDVFGSIEPALLATERISTQHNCVSRDMVSIGKNRFIFGYNIHFGLKQTTELGDVFDLYEYHPADHTFHKLDEAELFGAEFEEDFKSLYKYYKDTVFVKFMVIGPHLFMGMRVGKELTNIKCFKWLLKGDGSLDYLGNRSDHEYVFPQQQEFQWKRAHRDMQRSGEHPHVSIEDRLFVETVGGDLTIKIEDNTETGQGIYEELVDDPDQTLDDAEILYATVGPLIVLKVLPYREEHYRYLVYNEKTQTVVRCDAIGHSCVLLPDDHGLIFANGYLLLSGEFKTFDHGLLDMRFEKRIVSANGEDTFFVFYNRQSGDYVLLSYNLITRSIDTPVICSGYSLFENGRLLYFRNEDEAQKHHVIQIWQTPYINDEYQTLETAGNGSFISKIGNQDIVRCMSECREVLGLLGKDDSYADLYLDLVKKTGDLVDAYFWLNKDEMFDLAEPLSEINAAARSAVEEFEKVLELRNSAKQKTDDLESAAKELIREIEHSPADDIIGFVNHLAQLRRMRGEVIGLRDLRYNEPARIDLIEQSLVEQIQILSDLTVKFLLTEEALDPYREAVQSQSEAVKNLEKVADADATGAELDKAGSELEMLIEIVSNLKIDDATKTTAIIESISEIYSTLNAVRASLKGKRHDLAKSEGVAQFAAQMKLLGQAVVNFLDLCDTAEKCDEYLTKVMVQIEELDGKFSEFDEYLEQLAAKREEVYDAFEARKVALLEKRNKRANNLIKSAERILTGVRNRAASFAEINEINGYFAGDLMVSKVREIIDELDELGDSVKAADIQTRLKTLREDAVRQLKDRNELFVDGTNIIQFGKHQFTVNTQELELTVVPQGDEMSFHLAGTDFFERIDDPDFLKTRSVWSQELVSENRAVYRSEYLAYLYLLHAEENGQLEVSDDLLSQVQAFANNRYSEGYTKGVHDHDAELILRKLLPMHNEVGMLRYSPAVRAFAMLFWKQWHHEDKSQLEVKLRAQGMVEAVFVSVDRNERKKYQAELEREIDKFAGSQNLNSVTIVQRAAEYLIAHFARAESFEISSQAAEWVQKFHTTLSAKRVGDQYDNSLAELDGNVIGQYQVIGAWLRGFAASVTDDLDAYNAELQMMYLQEAAAHLLYGGHDPKSVVRVELMAECEGLLGQHAVVSDGKYHFHYNLFIRKMLDFSQYDVPVYQSYQETKSQLLELKRDEMRLDEFKPRVMSSFVRNRLLNEVYLPIIGDNLAKQMGTAGKDTRTDRMGMLLLISPPGYGKTTLMEYIADRLGITFMKINGPALGHEVKSLDPAEAPNASAREEVQKLNLALEMGDNVMIYLDDIQHTHSEFLQKFISLCDGQRKIEGVYKGQAKTYDLRGKKVAVVMAGNPYTETGGKFQIPDMLANRADTYNLGDILGGHEAAFKASYIENSLTSNAVLSKLSSRSQQDVYAVMKLVEGAPRDEIDFEAPFSASEVEDFIRVMTHLYRVRDSILRVNLEYIHSAAQEDNYRVEPAFKLQGSYRNMNRIAEKVIPLMTDEEVSELVISHYESESQTLTTGAEANLLKFKEMEGIQTASESARWQEIKDEFSKQKLLGGAGDDDPVARVVAQMSQFNDGLSAINGGLQSLGSVFTAPKQLDDPTLAKIESLISGLRSVPVQVDIKVVPVQEQSSVSPKNTDDGKMVDIEPEVRQLE
ncbi:DNA repair ATPase [Persicirhabdus sediminis]|uniref:DNA repair ATPase n=1 Tax=Persicirhabdus sediminis TaxID=454144 RepID=A0A8J7MBR8_9BACT|nr:DNA repair ATPase [Persicirhabdus sediminis]MBK1790086.1 DNA repair ATPase [Persicirhabdus sediminis]